MLQCAHAAQALLILGTVICQVLAGKQFDYCYYHGMLKVLDHLRTIKYRRCYNVDTIIMASFCSKQIQVPRSSFQTHLASIMSVKF